MSFLTTLRSVIFSTCPIPEKLVIQHENAIRSPRDDKHLHCVVCCEPWHPVADEKQTNYTYCRSCAKSRTFWVIAAT